MPIKSSYLRHSPPIHLEILTISSIFKANLRRECNFLHSLAYSKYKERE